MKIIINQKDHELTETSISYEGLVRLAGAAEGATVTYRGPRNGDTRREGELADGQMVRIEPGMLFNIVLTNRA